VGAFAQSQVRLVHKHSEKPSRGFLGASRGAALGSQLGSPRLQKLAWPLRPIARCRASSLGLFYCLDPIDNRSEIALRDLQV
jgi:hypothetical protein